MPINFKLATKPLARLSRVPSAAFWLQAGACAVVGWSLLHGGLSVAPAPEAMPLPAAGAPQGAAARAAAASASLQLAATPSLEGAKLALTTIDVIVIRNDTLDR